MSLTLSQESAFNLSLSGSTGTFRVGKSDNIQHSHEVRFLLTHVGLDLTVPQNQTLLRHLAPVREIFRSEELEFDEIMQRDIDDARVSHELVPYLLDKDAKDLIKIFPPVVIILLPTQPNAQKPDELYPKIVIEEIPEQGGKHGLRIIRSGEVGNEVFQFEQPIYNGKLMEHDLVKLRIDTNKSQLVIVDGQHRAMALLALFRNLKQDWTDAKRAPYRHYYSEWTPNFINQFKIEQVNLPLMICTIPSLDKNYTGEYNLKRAARSVFLTLNKTARKVSDSRNKLLDDNDLISHFMRECLSIVKNRRSNSDSTGSLQIHNVELDQASDRNAIQSAVAITGVNHFYYMIEHMMLDDGTVNGAKKRAGIFAIRKDLERYHTLKRLGARDLLGDDVANSMDRERFSLADAETLSEPFMAQYGNVVIQVLDNFRPFRCHSEACLKVKRTLEERNDARLISILFEGQGAGRIFDEHRKSLDRKLDDGRFSNVDVPQIRIVQQDLRDTAKRREETEELIRKIRATNFFDATSARNKLFDDSGELVKPIRTWLNDMFRNVFSTVAFQSAIVCGFVRGIEKASDRLAGDPVNVDLLAGDSVNVDLLAGDAVNVDLRVELDAYIESLNSYFCPLTVPKLRKLINVFGGLVTGAEPDEWEISDSKSSFRSVVYRGEMQPDQWPAYRAILLEIWTPVNSALKEFVANEREACRKQVFESLHKVYKLEFCREHLKPEDSLTDTEKNKVFASTFAAYDGLLKNIGSPNSLHQSDMKQLVEAAPAAATEEG